MRHEPSHVDLEHCALPLESGERVLYSVRPRAWAHVAYSWRHILPVTLIWVVMVWVVLRRSVARTAPAFDVYMGTVTLIAAIILTRHLRRQIRVGRSTIYAVTNARVIAWCTIPEIWTMHARLETITACYVPQVTRWLGLAMIEGNVAGDPCGCFAQELQVAGVTGPDEFCRYVQAGLGQLTQKEREADIGEPPPEAE